MKRTCICIMLAAAALLLLASCGRNAPPTAAPETTAPAPEPSITEEPAMTEPVLTSEPVPAFGCDALFFGDSITADSNFETFFPDLRIVNLGVYGDTLEDLLARVPSVRALRPARIFLLGGINCLREDSFEDCVAQYAELLDALRAACPEAEITVQSVLPVADDLTHPSILTNDTIRRFNARIAALAAARGCAYADLWPAYEKDGELDPALTRDGLHLNFTAYGPWAEAIAPYIEP